MKKLCLLLGLYVALLCPAGVYAQSTAVGTSDAEGSSVASQGATCNITTTSLPLATQSVAYTTTLSAANCVGTLTWSITSGTLPAGLTLNATTGAITGTPTGSGTSSFRVGVTDSLFNTDIYDASLSITAAPSTGGPLLPDATLLSWNTARSATPASGPYVCVGTLANVGALSGGCSATFTPATAANLQLALNSLVCGNILVMQNTIYPQLTGSAVITIPNTVCPDTNWIWVTRDFTDTTFPAEGQRVDPSFAGLPHSVLFEYPYPSWNTNPNATTRHMPQLIAKASNATSPILLKEPSSGTGVAAASHWRFIGLEVTRDQTADIFTSLIDLSYSPGASGQDCATNPLVPYVNQTVANTALMVTPTACMNVQPNNIIFEQMLIHGDAQRQTSRGVNFAGVLHVALLDSFGWDIQLSEAGGGGDAQFYFWGGGHTFGNVGFGKFVNNLTAASTMSSLFCGSFTETLNPVTGFDGVPHDVWFSQDHMIKNPLWNTQNGQTLLESETIEGVTYPPANDQKLVINPSALQLAQGQTFQLQLYWGNDSFGGLNRISAAIGSFTIDGISCTFTGNPAPAPNYCLVAGSSNLGVITRNPEHNVGSVPWVSANQITYSYTPCTGSGVPLAVCNVATTLGDHVVTANAKATDSRAGSNLAKPRTLSASSTVTVVSANPTKLIAVSPNLTDLQIQPSYSDSNGNTRQFCYTLFEFANYTTGTLTWKVDTIVNGNSSVGTISSPSGMASGEVVYCSGTTTGVHNVIATDGTVTSAPSAINVNNRAPIIGYDFKPFTSKNGWEAKCGNRLLLEKSFIELAWGSQGNGGGQQGHCMLIQSINQTNQQTDGNGVTVGYGPSYNNDFTVRGNMFKHFGAGFVVVPLNLGKGTHRILVTQNVCDDCNNIRWGNGFSPIVTALQAGGTASTGVLIWTSATNPTADHISITHNTILGNFTTPFALNNYIAQYQLLNFTIQNNIVSALGSQTFVNANGENNDANLAVGTGASNTEALAFQGAGWNAVALGSCKTPKAGSTFYCNVSGTGWELSNNGGAYASVATPPGFVLVSPYVFDHNNLTDSTASSSVFSSSPIWQLGNAAVGFVNYNSANNGDYRLCTIARGCATNSIFAAGQANQASDGTDLGADVTTVNANVSAVLLGTRTP